MKRHIYEIDLIRTICCIGIVIYHFACHTTSNLSVLKTKTNFDVGSILVTIFFMVSGFVLYHNNKQIDSLKMFYYKRFKSIFPCFYLCWFIFYVINVVKVKTPFYAGNPIKLLLTLIGQDGYFGQRIVTYYTVGEWFLGALIIVYALYPLLLKGYKKNKFVILLLLSFLTAIVHIFNIPVISPGFPGIIESSLKLYLGILMYEQIDNINTITITGSLIYVILYTFIKINFINVALDIIYSLCLFIVFYKLGSILFRKENKVVSFIASISYQMYLLHHQIINYVFEIYNPGNIFVSFMVMIICLILIIVFAYMIKKLINMMMNTELYRRIENAILE